jgi:hypothetical protein
MAGPDFIVNTGDLSTFNPTFGRATVLCIPCTSAGTSKSNIDGAVACALGDVAAVSAPDAKDPTPCYSMFAMARLTTAVLGSDKLGQATRVVAKGRSQWGQRDPW